MKDGTADSSAPNDHDDAHGSGGTMDKPISALVERLRNVRLGFPDNHVIVLCYLFERDEP